MPDDPNNTGKADRDRINIHNAFELLDWSGKLGVSQEDLKKAVEKVGSKVEDVKQKLGK